MQSTHKKLVLLALVSAIVLSLCPVDHLMPMDEASAHSSAAIAECIPDACVTLGSKKTESQEISPQAKLLSPADFHIPSISLQSGASRVTSIADRVPPPILNKPYQLHASYLI